MLFSVFQICLDCKERFTWDHYEGNNNLIIPAPERCEECTFLKKGICSGCFENPVQEGRCCQACNKLKLTGNYYLE